jgi:hypothetical protein
LNKKFIDVSSVFLFVSIMLLMLLPGNSFATTYDLKSDWSDTNNPNGVWAYWQETTILPQQSDFAGKGSGFALAPFPGLNHVPVWLQYDKDLDNFKSGDIAVHATSHDSIYSSKSYAPTYLTWTSPINGTISISGNIWFGGYTGSDYRATNWNLYLNDNQLDSGMVDKNNSSRNFPMYFDGDILNLTVKTGDIVKFQVSEINGDTFSWMTGVNLTIDAQPVPIPGALWLLGSGIAAIIGIRKKGNMKG